MNFGEFKKFSEGFEVTQPNYDINSSFSGSSNNDPAPLEEESLNPNGVVSVQPQEEADSFFTDSEWEEILKNEDTSALEDEAHEEFPEDTVGILEEEEFDEELPEDTDTSPIEEGQFEGDIPEDMVDVLEEEELSEELPEDEEECAYGEDVSIPHHR